MEHCQYFYNHTNCSSVSSVMLADLFNREYKAKMIDYPFWRMYSQCCPACCAFLCFQIERWMHLEHEWCVRRGRLFSLCREKLGSPPSGTFICKLFFIKKAILPVTKPPKKHCCQNISIKSFLFQTMWSECSIFMPPPLYTALKFLHQIRVHQ